MSAYINDAPCVLVRVDLRPSTYQVLAAAAKERHVQVGDLLSALADRAVTKPPPPKRKPLAPRPRVGTSFDDRIRELNAEGMSDSRIAKEIGISQATVSRRRAALDLSSPTPRTPGSGRRAS